MLTGYVPLNIYSFQVDSSSPFEAVLASFYLITSIATTFVFVLTHSLLKTIKPFFCFAVLVFWPFICLKT